MLGRFGGVIGGEPPDCSSRRGEKDEEGRRSIWRSVEGAAKKGMRRSLRKDTAEHDLGEEGADGDK